MGVQIPHRNTSNYRVSMSKWGKQTHFGCYSTVIEAYEVYKIEKSKYAKELAERYKNIIDDVVYKKLINFNFDDWIKYTGEHYE